MKKENNGIRGASAPRSIPGLRPEDAPNKRADYDGRRLPGQSTKESFWRDVIGLTLIDENAAVKEFNEKFFILCPPRELPVRRRILAPDSLCRTKAVHSRADDAARVASPFSNRVKPFDPRRVPAELLAQDANGRGTPSFGADERCLARKPALPAAVQDRDAVVERVENQRRDDFGNPGRDHAPPVTAGRPPARRPPCQEIRGALNRTKVFE